MMGKGYITYNAKITAPHPSPLPRGERGMHNEGMEKRG